MNVHAIDGIADVSEMLEQLLSKSVDDLQFEPFLQCRRMSDDSFVCHPHEPSFAGQEPTS